MLSVPLLKPAEKKSWCYYPHWSRDSVSPIYGIYFHQLDPLGRVGLVGAISVCCLSLFVLCLSSSQCIFLRLLIFPSHDQVKASYWPSDHMISSRPLTVFTFFFFYFIHVFHFISSSLFYIFHKKEAISPFVDASGNKNIGATIRIGQEIWCVPYAGFFKAKKC